MIQRSIALAAAFSWCVVSGAEAQAPAGTAYPLKPAVVSRLNAEIVKVLALPVVRQQFAVQGMEILGGTPDQFGAHIAQEIAKWAKVIRASGTRAE